MCIPCHDKPVWHLTVTHGAVNLSRQRTANTRKWLWRMQGRPTTGQMLPDSFMSSVAMVRVCMSRIKTHNKGSLQGNCYVVSAFRKSNYVHPWNLLIRCLSGYVSYSSQWHVCLICKRPQQHSRWGTLSKASVLYVH